MSDDKPKPQEEAQETDNKEWYERFWDSLQALLTDVLTLEVTTYVTTGAEEGEIKLKIAASDTGDIEKSEHQYNGTLMAYTKVKLDADTLVLLPVSEEFALRKEIYDIHKEHVEASQKTRTEMVSAMLNAIASLGDMLPKPR